MKTVPGLKYIIILIALSYFFFFFGNGILSLTNPDEVFYAQTAKEMSQRNSWAVPYLFGEPQFEKPVLTYFLMRVGFLALGINNFSARLMPALFAMLGVIAVYLLGLAGFREKKKAFFCALVLMSCGFYIAMARTVFTDMIFSALILFSLASFFLGYSQKEKKAAGLLLFFAFAALATLAKGPLGLFIPLLSVILFLAFSRSLKFILCKEALWGVFIFLAIALPWYIFVIHKFGYAFVREFFYNDHIRRVFEAEHKGNDNWYFYPLTAIGVTLPWAIFTLFSLFCLVRRISKKGAAQPLHLFLGCWILTVFLIFQSAHSKLVSYILPMVPPLAMLCGDFIYNAIADRRRLIRPLLLLNWLVFAGFVPFLLFAAHKYSNYVTHKAPIYGLAAVFSALLLALLALISRKKFFPAAYLFMLPVPLVLYFALFSHGYFEDYVSSKNACAYLLENYQVNNRILCSRSYARGVRYYTDKEVAVININGRKFWSPHPVPDFLADEPAREFIKKQGVTYCVLKKGSVEDIERIAGSEFTVQVLKKIGDEYIVRVSRN